MLYKLLIILLICHAHAYKPVVIIHGIDADNKTVDKMVNWIRQAHPGQQVVAPNINIDLYSWKNLWKQVDDFWNVIVNISNSSPNGYHLIGKNFVCEISNFLMKNKCL